MRLLFASPNREESYAMKRLCLLALMILLPLSQIAHAARVHSVSFTSGENSLIGSITTEDGIGPIDGTEGHRIIAWTFRQRGPEINFDISSTDSGTEMICDEICFATTETSLFRPNTFENEPNQVFFIHTIPDPLSANEVGFVPLIGDWGVVNADRVVVNAKISTPMQDPDFIWKSFVYGEYPAPMSFPRVLAPPNPNPAPGTLVNLMLAFIVSGLAARRSASRKRD